MHYSWFMLLAAGLVSSAATHEAQLTTITIPSLDPAQTAALVSAFQSYASELAKDPEATSVNNAIISAAPTPIEPGQVYTAIPLWFTKLPPAAQAFETSVALAEISIIESVARIGPYSTNGVEGAPRAMMTGAAALVAGVAAGAAAFL